LYSELCIEREQWYCMKPVQRSLAVFASLVAACGALYIAQLREELEFTKAESASYNEYDSFINQTYLLLSARMGASASDLKRITNVQVLEVERGPCISVRPNPGVYGGQHTFCFSRADNKVLSEYSFGQ
jgi:hypothetical protein